MKLSTVNQGSWLNYFGRAYVLHVEKAQVDESNWEGK